MAVHTHAPSRQECGEKIPQGDIRLGQEYNSRHGGRGAVAWRHLACICPRGQLIGSDHMTDREDGVKTGALLSALLYPSLFLTSPIRARRVVCGWTHSGDAQRVLALSALVAAARCARLFSRPSLLSNSINPGVTSCVNAQGYKVRLVPSEARLPLLYARGWESLSGEQQAAVRAVCRMPRRTGC